MNDAQEYQSPYSWRYASPQMRAIWSEHHKRLTWRRVWVALAHSQVPFGLVSPEQAADLESSQEKIDIERALEIEAEIHHDLMAELKTFAEQCPLGSAILHLGATSMDIEDNADALRIRASLALVVSRLDGLLTTFAEKIEASAGLTVLGYTHLQPAEPTTLGYRLAFYAQDLLESRGTLNAMGQDYRGKGFKGAVGSGAAYGELIGIENLERFEQDLSRRLGLPFFRVTTQTYPRKQEYDLVCQLAGLGAVLHKFAFDVRVLQSPLFGEWSEPFGSRQVGSSAMPFKRNPIQAEKIDSLARSLSVLPQVAWGNAALSLLERTLDDSANRRSFLGEAFLICDELLAAANRILKGLVVHQPAVDRNLAVYAPFAATERVLVALVQRGGDRQAVHERLREHAMAAWQAVQGGAANPLADLLAEDAQIGGLLGQEQIRSLMDINGYTGLAERRALETAAAIRALLAEATSGAGKRPGLQGELR